MSDDPAFAGDTLIIAQAKARWQRCADWEAEARNRQAEDYKFVNADSDNMYQWPAVGMSGTTGPSDNPVRLTVNMTRQHCLQIKNDAKQNKPGVNIRPTGGEATYDAAQTYEGVVRYIEKISRAEQAYDTAMSFMVDVGIGYWRVVTDWVSSDSFDQDIFIRRVKDPNTVFLDPDINEIDGSDARFGFVFEDVPREEFRAEYGEELSSTIGNNTISNDGWIDDKHVRVCEYFARSLKKDKLISFPDPEGGGAVVTRKSAMPADVWARVSKMDGARVRDIEEPEITWYKIAGDKIIDRKPWPGAYIPIVRIIGEETVINGTLDRKGHTRSMKDPQRIFNYWNSAAVRQVANAPNSPYLMPSNLTEEQQSYWNRLNTPNPPPYLPYNAIDDQGNPLPPPTRVDPAIMAPAFITGLQLSQQQMMLSSGQYEADFGQKSNERSGKAINERQRQGDTATYHFIDGLAIGIRYTGMLLIDLIPKVYDTPRIIRVLAEDGTTETQVRLDPSAEKAFQEGAKDQENALAIFNPNVGRYAVEADVGPSYATRRQEAWNAMTQIVTVNEKLTEIIGDLLFANADFPGADEIAKRLKRLVPANLKDDAPTPEMATLEAQNKELTRTLAEVLQRLADKDRELKDKDTDYKIREYEAATKRIPAVSNAAPELGLDTIQPLVEQMIRDALAAVLPKQPASPVVDLPEPVLVDETVVVPA